ncbi:MAG: HDOD domain-containing protein, partial [Armatimonadota bacterium]
MAATRRSWDELHFLFSSRQGLPPIPEPALRLTKIVEDTDFSAIKAEEAILADPGLTASVLKAAQSASFAQQQPIASVRQAILILGGRQLKSLASSLMTMAVINKGHHRSALPLDRLAEAGTKIGRAFGALSTNQSDSAYS